MPVAAANNRAVRGFTILEVLVAMAIFTLLGGALITLMTMAANAWRDGERKRRTYERAQEVLSQFSYDLEAVHSRDPVEEGLPMARFFCTLGAQGQRLSFVRTYGSGPEKGTGEPTGLIGVTYQLDGRTLYRSRPAPPRAAKKGDLASLIDVAAGPPEVLATNVIFVGFRFWSQYTQDWNGPEPNPKRPEGSGPETVWDSTRGAGIGAVDEKTGNTRPFFLYRGSESLAVPTDDVFPEIVEMTLVVEPDENRATKCELKEAMSESDGVAYVTTTRGFPHPADTHPYILIGNEWVELKDMKRNSFKIKRRGVRGTARGSHDIGTTVRVGTTFVLRASVPAYREDWSSRADFLQKLRTP